MGVVCVLNHPVPEGKSGQTVVDSIVKRLEQLGATKTGNFLVDCETYSSQQPSRQVSILHNSEQPASCFAVLDTGTCLVADCLFDGLMAKLRGVYQPRKNAKVESKGQRFELQDFLIKVGSVVLGQNTSFKGILVEVEYCPCDVAADCWALLRELLEGFLGPVADVPNSHFKSKMDQLFTPTDTMMQYLEHFDNFRKLAAPQTR